MALKNPWEIASKPKQVPVYADGERIGTAESASVNLTGFYGPIKSVELTDLREWRAPVSLLQRNYDVMVRDQKIEELEVEVERLKASRKEQAEKHRQKMRNLQQNFEQQANGKTMNSKLRRELQASKDYAQTLRKTVDRQTSEINSLKSKYYRQSFELDVRVKEIKGLQAKLDRERGNDSYWHEKYLESEKVVADLSESRKEQAEKHKQKMRNLQQNFEAREQAKNRNTKLQRQVKNLTRALETSRADAEYWHGRFIEVEDSLNDPSELAHSWRRLDQQRIDLASENRKLRQKHDYLVDALNAISHTVNDAAERQDGGGL